MLIDILRCINEIIQYNAVQWNIGFSNCTKEQLVENGSIGTIRWVKHQFKDRWFADPFFLDTTENEYDILVEEMDTINKKGKISRMIINKESMEIKSLTTILELPTHLSFPNILCKNGNIYFYPENAESCTLDFYLFNPKNNEVRKQDNIIQNLPIVDAQFLEIGERFLLLGTIKPNQSKDTVTVFESTKWNGEFQKKGEFKVAARTARGAGKIFKYNGNLYRPSQDSAKAYGNGVVISKIDLNNEQLISTEIKRFYPQKGTIYNAGLHTINFFHDNILVLDGYYYNNPTLVKIINKIKAFIQ